jgi:hypothetical protein
MAGDMQSNITNVTSANSPTNATSNVQGNNDLHSTTRSGRLSKASVSLDRVGGAAFDSSVVSMPTLKIHECHFGLGWTRNKSFDKGTRELPSGLRLQGHWWFLHEKNYSSIGDVDGEILGAFRYEGSSRSTTYMGIYSWCLGMYGRTSDTKQRKIVILRGPILHTRIDKKN